LNALIMFEGDKNKKKKKRPGKKKKATIPKKALIGG